MTLVKCEDCSREISNLSEACPHCGRPLREHRGRTVAEDEKTGSPSQRVRSLAGQARDAATGAASGARRVVPQWAGHLKGVLPQAKELSSKAIKKLIQDRDVEVLLLPTGSAPDKFICTVDLTDTLDAISTGVLVRPRLVVWTHRSDVDRDRLAFILEEQFADQVAAFRAAKTAEHEETATEVIATSEEVRKDAQRLGRSSRKALIAAMLGIALVTRAC